MSFFNDYPPRQRPLLFKEWKSACVHAQPDVGHLVTDFGVSLFPCYLPCYQPDTHLLRLTGASPTQCWNRCCQGPVKNLHFEKTNKTAILCKERGIYLGADCLGMMWLLSQRPKVVRRDIRRPVVLSHWPACTRSEDTRLYCLSNKTLFTLLCLTN